MDKKEKLEIVAVGGVDEKENQEVAERSQKVVDLACAKLNPHERTVALCLTSVKRTKDILIREGDLPREVGDMLLSCIMDVARLIPPEKVDKAKVVAASIAIEVGVKLIVEEVHAKHCPECGKGEHHAVKPPKAWN